MKALKYIIAGFICACSHGRKCIWFNHELRDACSIYESNLPKPNNPNVIIKKTSEEYVAVLKFGGTCESE